MRYAIRSYMMRAMLPCTEIRQGNEVVIKSISVSCRRRITKNAAKKQAARRDQIQRMLFPRSYYGAVNHCSSPPSPSPEPSILLPVVPPTIKSFPYRSLEGKTSVSLQMDKQTDS